MVKDKVKEKDDEKKQNQQSTANTKNQAKSNQSQKSNPNIKNTKKVANNNNNIKSTNNKSNKDNSINNITNANKNNTKTTNNPKNKNELKNEKNTVENKKIEKEKDKDKNKEIKNEKPINENNIDTNSNVLETETTGKALNVVSIFGILLAVFLVIILTIFFIFSIIMNSNTNIFSGVYVKGVDVSNMAPEDAKHKINAYVKNNLPEEIVLSHGDYEATLNTEELNISFDVDSAIDAAYDLGRGGNLISNGFDILSIILNNKNVEPTLTIDEDILTDLLKDISLKLPDKVIQSGYYIDGNNLILNKGQEGNVIDIDAMKEVLKKHIQNLDLANRKIEIITKHASPKKLNIDEIYEKVHKEAVDAKFTPEPLSVTPSENGVDFDISLEDAKAKLEEDNQECVIPLKVIYPSFTTNMIGTEAFPDKLSEFSTYYAASNYNRTTNLIIAAGKINGTVLMPGETFSYNQVVGERTIAAGYKEAPIYVEGRVEDGLGGGICQITTTLYNAVAYANLEIIERTNHQFVPSYVGAGRDATVVYGALDFKFKNNRDYPIKILCSVGGGVANFQILGLRNENDYDVEIYSRITSQTANATNSETYKILKKNGQIVDQTLLSRDTYKRH